jgi:hypothetical protein
VRGLLTGLLGLLLVATPAWAVDYAKIVRKLVKEPAYQSKAPKYVLLLFGREAKLRVWLVADGEAVYLDRNGDGDLTTKGERFEHASDCKDVEIADPDGRTRYVISHIRIVKGVDSPEVFLDLGAVGIKGALAYRQFGKTTRLRDNPREAAVLHFHGPLTVGVVTLDGWTADWKAPPNLALVTGEKPTDLQTFVGTVHAKCDCGVFIYSHHGECRHTKSGEKHKPAFANGVHPVVDIEFPPKAPGAPPVKKRYQLDEFC